MAVLSLVITKVPRKGVSWQNLVRCDYFRTSVVFQSLDIYNIVGVMPRFSMKNLPLICGSNRWF